MLPLFVAITLTSAVVHSHLYYCNNFFYGLPKYSIHRLKKVQNTVARIVTYSSHFLQITPTQKSLIGSVYFIILISQYVAVRIVLIFYVNHFIKALC